MRRLISRPLSQSWTLEKRKSINNSSKLLEFPNAHLSLSWNLGVMRTHSWSTTLIFTATEFWNIRYF